MVSAAVAKKRLHIRSVVWHVMTTIIAIFWSLPARMIANCWHYVYEIPIPRRWRRVVYQAYARYWHMRLEEAEKPLEEYETLKKVFTRSLKPGLRTIDRSASFVSPIDGSIIMHGLLHAVPPHQGVQEVEEAEAADAEEDAPRGDNFEIEETNPPAGDAQSWNQGPKARNNMVLVKAVPYRIQDLLGVPPPEPLAGNTHHVHVMFLPASEYHHFHSPVQFNVLYRIRTPGHVMPLLPEKTRWVPHMLWSNERVTLLGNWQHGFFAMTFLAATALVGRMKLDAEPDLKTNQPIDMIKSIGYLTGWRPTHAKVRRSTHAYGVHRVGAVPIGGEEGSTSQEGLDVREYNPPLHFAPGDHIGHFSVGSGIAMVYEAPRDWKLRPEATTVGHSFKLGEAMAMH